MRHLAGVLAVIACLFSVSVGSAQGPGLFGNVRGPLLLGPNLGQAGPLEPIPEGAYPVPMPSGCELFPCVKYKDECKIHPCARPMVVQVKDPCACKSACNCCTPACVNVKICVPPCDCAKVKITRHGAKVRYDFGKYAVDIISRNGYIKVDYDA